MFTQPRTEPAAFKKPVGRTIEPDVECMELRGVTGFITHEKKKGYPMLWLGTKGKEEVKIALHTLLCWYRHGKKGSPRDITGHMCNNKGCINPRHLQWLSPEDNIAFKKASKQTGINKGDYDGPLGMSSQRRG